MTDHTFEFYLSIEINYMQMNESFIVHQMAVEPNSFQGQMPLTNMCLASNC